MIPEGKLYNDQAREAGEIMEHHPSEYIHSMIAEGDVNFGRGIVRGSASNKAKLPSSSSEEFLGVAGFSIQAADLDNRKYGDGDALAVVESGVVSVEVEEAVEPGDDVRLRISEEAGTKGYQKWEFASAKAGTDSTGLANNTTAYTAAIKVNGTNNNISVVGSAAQTLAALITQINADLAGAVASIADGALKVESSLVGDGSTIEISDVDLFTSLTDANDAPEIAIDGEGDPDETTEPGKFRKTAIAGKTAVVTGAKWKDATTGAGVTALLLSGNFSLTPDN
jgi:hypothetical protein